MEIKVSFGKYFIPTKDQKSLKIAGLKNGVISIGIINSFGKGKVVIAGHFVGPNNFVENIEGKLNYQPEKTLPLIQPSGKELQ